MRFGSFSLRTACSEMKHEVDPVSSKALKTHTAPLTSHTGTNAVASTTRGIACADVTSTAPIVRLDRPKFCEIGNLLHNFGGREGSPPDTSKALLACPLTPSRLVGPKRIAGFWSSQMLMFFLPSGCNSVWCRALHTLQVNTEVQAREP